MSRHALFIAMSTLALALPSAYVLGAPSGDASSMDMSQGMGVNANSPLVQEIRLATAKYKDINVALHKETGWVVATPCVSGPDTGAMGVHLVNPSRIADGVLDPSAPEALIYEPMADGSMRLVGVEFIEVAADWAARNPSGPPPEVAGNLMNLLQVPNRFGLPEAYYLHVWAWQDNPKGTFADWNTKVTCALQPMPSA
ncbi:MAG TPA: hypothetical protein VJR95_11355 [Rhodanobacter sp.]|nr:hypothetical protein [Rhodanobacter sp.]